MQRIGDRYLAHPDGIAKTPLDQVPRRSALFY